MSMTKNDFRVPFQIPFHQYPIEPPQTVIQRGYRVHRWNGHQKGFKPSVGMLIGPQDNYEKKDANEQDKNPD